MKSINFILAAAAMVAAAGCAKEVTEAPAVKRVPITISTTTEKTALDGTNVLWSEGDRITVWDGSNTNTFILTSGAGTANATFAGTVTEGAEELYAVYPETTVGVKSTDDFSTGSKVSSTKTLTGFAIPHIQYAVKGGFMNGANVSIGRVTESGGNYSVSMKNVGVVVNITIPSSLTDVKSVSLCNAVGGINSGDFSILKASADDGTPVPLSTTYFNDAILQNEDGSALEPGTYSLVVLPSLNGASYKTASSRNTFNNSQLILTRLDGTVAHKTLTGQALVTRNSALSVDLSSAEFTWNTQVTVTFPMSTITKALSDAGYTTWETRSKEDVPFTVDGHTLKLIAYYKSDTEYSSYYSAGSYITCAHYDGTTKISSGAKAYIQLPDDFDGYKLYSFEIATSSQDKTITINDKIGGKTIWTAYARQGKSSSGAEGRIRLFTKEVADAEDHYFVTASHSGTFNFYSGFTCIYEKPVN